MERVHKTGTEFERCIDCDLCFVKPTGLQNHDIQAIAVSAQSKYGWRAQASMQYYRGLPLFKQKSGGHRRSKLDLNLGTHVFCIQQQAYKAVFHVSRCMQVSTCSLGVGKSSASLCFCRKKVADVVLCTCVPGAHQVLQAHNAQAQR